MNDSRDSAVFCPSDTKRQGGWVEVPTHPPSYSFHRGVPHYTGHRWVTKWGFPFSHRNTHVTTSHRPQRHVVRLHNGEETVRATAAVLGERPEIPKS